SPHVNSEANVHCQHHLYDLVNADATFEMNNCTFHVHSYFFTCESPYFRRLWKIAGSTTETPINLSNDGLIPVENDTTMGPYYVMLNEVTTEEFELLLWVFYNLDYSVYKATTREWTLILRLAQQWEFPRVEALCWRELLNIGLVAHSPLQVLQGYSSHTNDEN
ncbi:hypothetical protein H4582DRAFT_1765193, partial [Lactarius indigo]